MEYNDYELLDFIAEADEDALKLMYKKYEPLIYQTAKKMVKYTKNTGLEMNDLIQEGNIGLSKAIETFDSMSEASFYTYAKLCIERAVISSIIKTTRLKRRILNESIPIDTTDDNGEGNDLSNLLTNDNNNPENILISEEKMNDIFNKVKSILTDFEMQVFELRVNNFQIKEIMDLLDKDYKSIDNAIQRIKTKLKKELNIN